MLTSGLRLGRVLLRPLSTALKVLRDSALVTSHASLPSPLRNAVKLARLLKSPALSALAHPLMFTLSCRSACG